MSAKTLFKEGWAIYDTDRYLRYVMVSWKKISLTVAPVLDGLAGSTQILILVEVLLGLKTNNGAYVVR